MRELTDMLRDTILVTFAVAKFSRIRVRLTIPPPTRRLIDVIARAYAPSIAYKRVIVLRRLKNGRRRARSMQNEFKKVFESRPYKNS